MAVDGLTSSERSALAMACEALLPDRPPLIAALTLLRLGGSSSRVAHHQERTLRCFAAHLPSEVRSQLAAELDAVDLGKLSSTVLTAPTCALATTRKRRRSEGTPPPSSLPPRLRESAVLWDCSREYYTSSGASAWTSGDVPYHISSSAFIASAYAEVVAAFIEDSTASAAADSEPLHVVDLGCGCGLLGVRVARALQRRGVANVCVVLADLDVAAARAQLSLPSAAALVSEGLLDVAQLDATKDLSEGWELLLSGRRIGRGSLRRPLVVLANYVFDSLPIELLRVRRQGDADANIPVADAALDTALEALTPTPDGRYAYRALPRIADCYFEDANQLALARRIVARARAELAAEAGTTVPQWNGATVQFDTSSGPAAEAAADASTSIQEAVAVAYVPTGAHRCLRSLHSLQCAASPAAALPRMLLLVGDKLVDRASLTRLAAAHAETGAPLRLAELPLFSIHGAASHGAQHGALSHGVCRMGIVEALRLSAKGAAVDGGTAGGGGTVDDDDAVDVDEVGKSAALMEFDVVGLVLRSHAATGCAPLAACDEARHRTLVATRRAFGRRLGRFGASEMERLTALIHETAQAESEATRPARRRATRRAARRPFESPPKHTRAADAADAADATDAAGAAVPHVPLRVLTQLLRLSECDWHVFSSLRRLLLERLPTAPRSDVDEAIAVATRCFEDRLTLSCAEWLASDIAFSRWLSRARRERAVAELSAAACADDDVRAGLD